MDWLSKVDPNVLVPTALAIAGWLWSKIRGEKKESANRIIDAVIETFAHEVLDRYTVDAGDTVEYLKRVRKYIDDRVWAVLKKRGVPRNGITQGLLNQSIERWSAWVGNQVTKIRARRAGVES